MSLCNPTQRSLKVTEIESKDSLDERKREREIERERFPFFFLFFLFEIRRSVSFCLKKEEQNLFQLVFLWAVSER